MSNIPLYRGINGPLAVSPPKGLSENRFSPLLSSVRTSKSPVALINNDREFAPAGAYYPGADLSVSGWTASAGTSLAGCVDEPIYADDDHVTSHDLTTSAAMSWVDETGAPATIAAGIWSLAIRPMFPEGTSGQIRLVMLDSGNSAVGASAWQTLTGAFVTYTLAITTSGVSDRFRLEIQP